MRQRFLPLNQLVSQPRDLMNWRQWRAQVFNRLGVSVFSIDQYVSLIEDFETRLVKLVRPRRFQRSPNFKASIFNPTDLQQITWWSTICLMFNISISSNRDRVAGRHVSLLSLMELWVSDLLNSYQSIRALCLWLKSKVSSFIWLFSQYQLSLQTNAVCSRL